MFSMQKVTCQSGKQRSSKAASYALCIMVERSHRQRLLHKQEGSDGVVVEESEVPLGHGCLQIMLSVYSASEWCQFSSMVLFKSYNILVMSFSQFASTVHATILSFCHLISSVSGSNVEFKLH